MVVGGRGDAHMHLGGAGVAHHLDDLLGGGAAHDRIVHQDHPLALEHGAVGDCASASRRDGGCWSVGSMKVRPT
jgi:hypothetical protein